MLIGITGSPASGKSAFAKMLRSKAKALRILEINDAAKKYTAYSSKDDDGTIVADMRRLNSAVKSELKILSGNNVAIVGHMMQELLIKPDICITVRAKPSILYKRQKARGYSLKKIKENMISEALDYCGEGASKMCRNSFEVETLIEKKEMAKYVESLIGRNAKKGAPLPDGIKALRKKKDMMGDFLRFIKRNNIGF
ncbi:MAG: AAA family ATPase [Candidatus Micrarchaeaceae archaeon]